MRLARVPGMAGCGVLAGLRWALSRWWAGGALALFLVWGAQARAADPPALRLEDTGGERLAFCYLGKVPNTRLVVVDKSRQRLMVFRYMGEFELEYEYPAATGKNPGPKAAEGDERTPVGIYFTTHRYLDNKVTVFGDRAIHLNYPNPFDKAAGRQGNGIYIHGTNGSLKERSSNGCITMRNEDLAKVYHLIEEQQTPVVVMERLQLAPPERRIEACRSLGQLEEYARAPLEAAQGHRLTVIPAPGKKPELLDEAVPDLAGLGQARPASLLVSNKGMLLLGLGAQWVLVTEQEITNDRQKIPVVRRFYLEGDGAHQAELLENHWLLNEASAARQLMAWAPKAVAKPAAVKPPPAVVATAKPAPGAVRPAPVSPARDRERDKEKEKEQEIRQMLNDWLQAWQSKNVNRYIGHYAVDFRSQGMDVAAWRRQKAYLGSVYKVIQVRAEDLRIDVNGERAKVTFIQHYRSDWHQDQGKKEMALVLRRGHWQIKSEEWEAITPRAGRAVSAKRGSGG